MEQNQIHILKEKIKLHTAYRDHAEFKRKRALYGDHFHDADNFEGERDQEQAIIDKLRQELESLLSTEKEIQRNGSYYIQCADCEEFVHQRRVRTHKCKTSPITQFNKRLIS